MSRVIDVFGDWVELGGIQRMGSLRADQAHGKEVFSFEYDREWLASPHVMLLDPALRLFEGPQYLAESNRPNFGLFLDSCPDRWGRLLMKRREAMAARTAGREQNRLSELDFLLGVHDEQRMGGLRFKAAPGGSPDSSLDGPFLSDEAGKHVPPWARLRELENAAWQIQFHEHGKDHEIREWFNLLMAPGSSLGGARPKAGVCDEQDELWIAKFPGRNDEFDVGAWEMLAHRLAKKSGIDVADAKIQKLGRQHHTFLSKRFDRKTIDNTRSRRHFASAMTMLGYSDGADFHDGASYLQLAEFLTKQGSDVDADLKELWRRIVFSICVCNSDDHLRNHGFLLEPGGWKLSPAYDINPSPDAAGLHLNISENDNSLSLPLALEVAKYFRLDDESARGEIARIIESVRTWPIIAMELGISRSEQELMRPAFRIADQ
ncbi:MAG: type II toxin-antitoxin system HipA family toxin [Bythopirellula sp.]